MIEQDKNLITTEQIKGTLSLYFYVRDQKLRPEKLFYPLYYRGRCVCKPNIQFVLECQGTIFNKYHLNPEKEIIEAEKSLPKRYLPATTKLDIHKRKQNIVDWKNLSGRELKKIKDSTEEKIAMLEREKTYCKKLIEELKGKKPWRREQLEKRIWLLDWDIKGAKSDRESVDIAWELSGYIEFYRIDFSEQAIAYMVQTGLCIVFARAMQELFSKEGEDYEIYFGNWARRLMQEFNLS